MNELMLDAKLVSTEICTNCKQKVDKKNDAYFESTYKGTKTKKSIKTIRHQNCKPNEN